MDPIQYVHKSHSTTIKSCSRQLYYKSILNVDEAFENETALAGIAMHMFGEEIYKSTKQDKWDDWKYWCEFFLRSFTKLKEDTLEKGLELNTVKDVKAEEYIEMIMAFLKQPYNRNAIPILIESPFRFFIRRGRKQYGFEGRIDQLLKIPVKDLPNDYFKDLAKKESREYVYIHRDLKAGDKKIMSKISLLTYDDINFYAYALAFGKFDLNNDGVYEKEVHHIPFAHAIYWLRDHLAYKRNTENNQKGDPRGPGMYLIRKTYSDLKKMEDELVNIWIKVNRGPYTRDGANSNLCQYCSVSKVCEYEWDNH